MESGYCTGFLDSALRILKRHYPNYHPSNVLPWSTYTANDIKMYSSKCSTLTGINLNYLTFFLSLTEFGLLRKSTCSLSRSLVIMIFLEKLLISTCS